MSTPFYASLKYKNTLRLLQQAKEVLSSLEQSNSKASVVATLNSTISSLSLKEQVLGYLEDLTQGSVHHRKLSSEELALYTSWVLDDNVDIDPLLDVSPRAYARLNYFRGYVQGAEDPTIAKQEILRGLYLESQSELDLSQVENIVLAGGGAKAFSLAGVIEAIENYQLVNPLPIKRVAGTSGGAIMAMGYAVGYSAQELDLIVKENAFGLFTLESRLGAPWLGQIALWVAKEKQEHPLHALSDNVVARYYHDALCQAAVNYLVEQNLTNDAKDCFSWLSKIDDRKEERIDRVIRKIPSSSLIDIDASAQRKVIEKYPFVANEGGVHFYSSPEQALRTAFRAWVGVDIIRGFFSDLLYDKLREADPVLLRAALDLPDFAEIPPYRLREFTFNELYRLHTLDPEKYKELHISMCVEKSFLKRFSKEGYHRFEHADASHEHDTFSVMPIADAVRVSMNLPWVYPVYEFSVGGQTFGGSDGGLLSNMSLSTFDKKYPPEMTIGVFYKTRSELEDCYDVTRLLVLPRSEKEIKQEIVNTNRDILKAERVFSDLVSSQQGLMDASLPNEGKINPLEIKEGYIKSASVIHSLYAKREALSQELKSLSKFSSPLLAELSKYSVSEIMKRYLNSKNTETLGSRYDLRRLVMINTGEVKTASFKLTSQAKDDQIRYGESGMTALLRGTYCLENHFYFHRLRQLSDDQGVPLSRFYRPFTDQDVPMKRKR